MVDLASAAKRLADATHAEHTNCTYDNCKWCAMADAVSDALQRAVTSQLRAIAERDRDLGDAQYFSRMDWVEEDTDVGTQAIRDRRMLVAHLHGLPEAVRTNRRPREDGELLFDVNYNKGFAAAVQILWSMTDQPERSESVEG